MKYSPHMRLTDAELSGYPALGFGAGAYGINVALRKFGERVVFAKSSDEPRPSMPGHVLGVTQSVSPLKIFYAIVVAAVVDMINLWKFTGVRDEGCGDQSVYGADFPEQVDVRVAGSKDGSSQNLALQMPAVAVERGGQDEVGRAYAAMRGCFIPAVKANNGSPDFFRHATSFTGSALVGSGAPILAGIV